ncbi:MAG: hypothetical protein AAGI72_24150 [Pseudomonadota bacterium]
MSGCTGLSGSSKSELIGTQLEKHRPIDSRLETRQSNSEERRPKLCLALSGGGVRAGATSLGVLQGLADHLSDFEYVASSSGGGYPVYGLLIDHLRTGADPKDLLSDGSDFANNSEKNSKFITRTNMAVGALGALLFAVPDTAIRLMASIVPAMEEQNVYPGYGTIAYSSSIRRTFSTARNPFKDYYINDLSDDFLDQFPYPIFITSVSQGRVAPKPGMKLDGDMIFEVTPRWLGSDSTQYLTNYPFDLDLGAVIAASGAAIDTPGFKDADYNIGVPYILKLLGFSIGVYLEYPEESNGIYLSDGGFIDNQAVHPLIARNCQTILALDATSDEDLTFEGWQKVSDNLETLDSGLRLSDLAASDGTIVKVGTSNGSVWNLSDHVWNGKIESDLSDEIIDLWVLKLGYAPRTGYNEAIETFARTNWKSRPYNKIPRCFFSKKGSKTRCAFPAESTINQSYSYEEFRAYRLLGKKMAELWLEQSSRLSDGNSHGPAGAISEPEEPARFVWK